MEAKKRTTAAAKAPARASGGPKSVAEIDPAAMTRGRTYRPSPDAWSDQVLYFLLVDRFSNGGEVGYRDNDGRMTSGGGATPVTGAPVPKEPRFQPRRDADNAIQTPKDARHWREAGDRFLGGNLKGALGKLGYLKRLGVTALWISPILKQAVWDEHSYHGYATQNFLQIEPRFGTADDLRALIEKAHELGLYVILDVIVNHAGDVFAYGEPGKGEDRPSYTGEEYPVLGFRNRDGKPTLSFGPLPPDSSAWPDGAVWPRELQDPAAFHRKGKIQNWDAVPEFEVGDFFDLKDLHLGEQREGGDFTPSPALEVLIKAYQYWIAWVDLDGFRLDTVKHMGQGATRHFARSIHTFAQSIGKRNFLIAGEIVGSCENALATLDKTSLDTALGVDEIPATLRDVVLGRGDPRRYFALFQALPERADCDPNWWRERLVVFFDDHDQVGRPVKKRFAAEFGEDRGRAESALIQAVGMNATVLGIPCLYYGTEQGFDGHALGPAGGDRYIREAMFGGEFGSRGSEGRHFFNEDCRLYQEISRILDLRSACPVLRQGSQYLRETSDDGERFAYPAPGPDGGWRGVVAWSRLFGADEAVVVLNSDPERERTTWVTVDAALHGPDAPPLQCLYSTDSAQIGVQIAPESRNGRAVWIAIPAAGFAVYGTPGSASVTSQP